MQTVILCGGKGTRLSQPNKCMAMVAGRPFIEWKKDNLRALGHPEGEWLFLVGQHGFAGHCESFARDAGAGRGKALWENRRNLDEWFWLTYGDTLLDYDRKAVERFHEGEWPVMLSWRGRDYGAMIVPRDAFDGRPFADVIIDLNPAALLVSEPWHHINTPADLAECEAWLLGRAA